MFNRYRLNRELEETLDNRYHFDVEETAEEVARKLLLEKLVKSI